MIYIGPMASQLKPVLAGPAFVDVYTEKPVVETEETEDQVLPACIKTVGVDENAVPNVTDAVPAPLVEAAPN